MTTTVNPAPVTEPEAPTCKRRPHYPGDTCECEARLAAVTTHTRTATEQGPDYCAECSEAISEWVSWPCDDAEPEAPRIEDVVAAHRPLVADPGFVRCGCSVGDDPRPQMGWYQWNAHLAQAIREAGAR